MTCRPWRWLWGLIPLALIALFIILGERGNIERDLRERSHGVLEKIGLGTIHSTFEGRDGIIAGTFYDEAMRGRAIGIVRDVWGVRMVADRARILDKVEPYTWSAIRRQGRIRLKGFVHTDADRKSVIGIARASFPGLEIDDRMKLARGDPGRDTWLARIGFGLQQLGHLKQGQARLQGDILLLMGEAATSAAYRIVHRALITALPFHLRLEADRVRPPRVDPFVWSAKLETGRLTLAGHVPNEQARTHLLALAAHEFPRHAVTDSMRFASGAPDYWEQAISVALRHLARLESGRVRLRGVYLDITGAAEREETAKAVAKAVHTGLPALFKSSEKIQFRKPTLPVIKDYSFMAALADGRLVLNGYVPGKKVRARLRATAVRQFPDRTIVDHLALGAGAPEGFTSMARLAIEGLDGLDSGRATLHGQHLTIEGETGLRRLAGEIETRLTDRRMAGYRTTAAVRVRETSPDWRAALDGDALTLSGQVPDRVTRKQLHSLVTQAFPGQRIVDRMIRTEAGDTTRWLGVVQAGLRMLARLSRGEVALSGHRLQFSGEARSASDITVIREWVTSGLPAGYESVETVRLKPPRTAGYDYSEVEDQIFEWARARREAKTRVKTAATERARREAETRSQSGSATMVATSGASGGEVSADACQKLLDTVVSHGIIRFRAASAELAKDSFSTLEALSRVVKRCPGVPIEVAIHTDSDGSAKSNQRLSERRARSVVAYLAGDGVASKRLQAVGYGDSRPLAPNDTLANKTKNRRIEFTVKTKKTN